MGALVVSGTVHLSLRVSGGLHTSSYPGLNRGSWTRPSQAIPWSSKLPAPWV